MRSQNIEEIQKETLEAKLEDSIFLGVIDFGLAYPDGFSYNQLNGLNLDGWERKIIDGYLVTAFKNNNVPGASGVKGNAETPFFLVEQGNSVGFMDNSHKYIIILPTLSSCNDE